MFIIRIIIVKPVFIHNYFIKYTHTHTYVMLEEEANNERTQQCPLVACRQQHVNMHATQQREKGKIIIQNFKSR